LTADGGEAAGISARILGHRAGDAVEPSSPSQVIEAIINGPAGSLWEGGTFTVALLCGPEYDTEPPEVTFLPPPFHPNMEMDTGRPVIPMLSDPAVWRTKKGLQMLLLELQGALASPIMEGACNYEAVMVMQEEPDEYARLAGQYVLASQKKAADAGAAAVTAAVAAVNLNVTQPMPAALQRGGVKPVKESIVYGRDPAKGNTFVPFPQKAEVAPRKPLVSFDDYYRQWSQVATTRKGAESAARPNTVKYRTQNRNNAVAEIETSRRDLIYGEAMGQSHGFGHDVWYTEEHHRIAATQPMAEKTIANFIIPELSRIPSGHGHERGGGGGGDDDDDLDAEADDLLNFVGGLDGDGDGDGDGDDNGDGES